MQYISNASPFRIIFSVVALVFMIVTSGCNDQKEHPKSYAVYAEFARGSNKVMKDGLNRRVFDTAESQSGSDITLQKDGSITLEPGTYHITGFSMVTTQVTMAPPKPNDSNNYPGYCMVYPKQFEVDSIVLKHQFCIGSPATALSTVPSLFDVMYTIKEKTDICVGHQVGSGLNGNVYLSVYDVGGVPSNYHVFARIVITKL